MSFLIENILKAERSQNDRGGYKNDHLTQSGRNIVYPVPLYSHDGGSYGCFDQWQTYQYYYDLYRRMKDQNYQIIRRETQQQPLSFYSNLHIYSKKKGGQVRFSMEQTDLLERQFSSHKYLSPQDRKGLAKTLKLTDR
ncbi:hematopoietically-expressed homeobox protein hhex isoform X2 [Coccinella septempunctata]|nr:hematopoietically-expressed homeobox protein hhex isoform X2 [Coccinella septempunctata]